LISTLFNNLKTSMDTSLKTVQKKVLNLIKLRTRKKNSKNKNLHSKDFANFSKKFWEIRSKKSKLVKDFTNHPALWSLVNMDGQQIWKES